MALKLSKMYGCWLTAVLFHPGKNQKRFNGILSTHGRTFQTRSVPLLQISRFDAPFTYIQQGIDKVLY